ncbi:IS3 family transposase [Cetobacterium sp.]|uniref:IS3 family transposase n=1 Tax=Cetobacterium sp. TaxID=2071632 RepID=UPI003F397447
MKNSLHLKFLAIKNVALENNYSIKFLCGVWNLNRRSYYKWLNKSSSARQIENEVIKEKILEIYHSVNKIYGFRRMTMNINSQMNKKYNFKRIYRLMRYELKISSVIRRKKGRYIKSSAEYKAENILNREFSADVAEQKILTDITEFKYGVDKKIYMCTTFDLYDKSILSYSLSNKANTELVLRVLENSYTKEIPENAVLHSDRGSQFTSLEYKEALERLGVTHSMSRVGKCIDNGPMEGFFGNIKSEKYYLKKYSNLIELENDISDYVKFYNEDRLQKNLGSLTPLAYRENNKETNVDN